MLKNELSVYAFTVDGLVNNEFPARFPFPGSLSSLRRSREKNL